MSRRPHDAHRQQDARVQPLISGRDSKRKVGTQRFRHETVTGQRLEGERRSDGREHAAVLGPRRGLALRLSVRRRNHRSPFENRCGHDNGKDVRARHEPGSESKAHGSGVPAGPWGGGEIRSRDEHLRSMPRAGESGEYLRMEQAAAEHVSTIVGCTASRRHDSRSP
jgi:hypothetical protein